jgi:hypothetical protein
MYQITINDPAIYQAGEAFARKNNSTLSEMVNKYVASLAAKALSHKEKKVTFTETKEFKDAMKYMDAFVAEDLSSPVSPEENGKGAMTKVKYGL